MIAKLSFLLAGVGAALLIAPVIAGPQEPATQDVEYLFIQSAAKASLGDGLLKLSGVSPSTPYLSDRPERIVGHAATAGIIASWSRRADCFAGEPPKATLSLVTDKAGVEIAVVLTNPRQAQGALIYDVEVLDGEDRAAGGPCSLFIDVIGPAITPRSFGGRHRQIRRWNRLHFAPPARRK